jgi:uridine phosphorylase
MTKISESNLIVNPDKSVYHLSIQPQHIGDVVITVGDPGRVYMVSQYFDDVDFEMNKREFITHTGTYKGKRITVISTGIGADNIELFFTELDALHNVDFKTRERKTKLKPLTVIRIGTSSALQEDIPVGAHLITDYAVGLDSLMNFYDLPMNSIETDLVKDVHQKLGLNFMPYASRGSAHLLEQLKKDMIIGNTISAPGFYAPQGREIRVPIKYPKLLEDLNYYHHDPTNLWFTNLEMETAGFYAMARLLSHQAICVNAVVANRVVGKFAKDPNKIVDELIKKVLDQLPQIAKS